MPKTLREIRQFVRGTVTHPSSSDIDLDAASSSLNIDPNARDGLLSGINDDLAGIELLANPVANLIDRHTQPSTYLVNDLCISNVFCIDISSVQPGKQDHLIRGYANKS